MNKKFLFLKLKHENDLFQMAPPSPFPWSQAPHFLCGAARPMSAHGQGRALDLTITQGSRPTEHPAAGSFTRTTVQGWKSPGVCPGAPSLGELRIQEETWLQQNHLGHNRALGGNSSSHAAPSLGQVTLCLLHSPSLFSSSFRVQKDGKETLGNHPTSQMQHAHLFNLILL